ncbi:MAG: hypothetical protein AAF357_02975 [Verrucomicrobiota bacterium]
MKTHLITTISLLITSFCFAAVKTEVITVTLGPKSFRDGDVIRIDSVESTSPSLEIGDQVIVRGQYRLDSEDDARLALFLTQTEGDGTGEIDTDQIIAAKRGWHDFTASITIKHKGYLHLTFYDNSTGLPFGGVYFGTSDQISIDAAVSVDHYETGR